MDIKVTVDVEIGAGAKVSLTEFQQRAVKNTVVALLTGHSQPSFNNTEQNKIQRKRRAIRSTPHRWTTEEDVAILRLNDVRQGKERTREMDRLVRLTGASRGAISTRKSMLLSGKIKGSNISVSSLKTPTSGVESPRWPLL